MSILAHLPATCRWLAQTEGAPAGGAGLGSMFLMYGLILAGFYFLMIAPQRKRAKEHAKMVSELKPGDNVLTAGGIFGTVAAFRGDRIVIKIADNTRVEMLRSSVQTKVSDEPKS